MGNIQVKDVPDELHEELRRRAAARDMTIRDYVLELLRRDQATPTMADWLEEVARHPPVGGDIDARAFVEAARNERDAELGRPGDA